jgi:DNA-binding FrmR family transcriptional regulator
MATTSVLEQELGEEVRAEVATRLRKIDGQVRGLLRMVEGGRGGSELLMQISSVQEALRGVGKVVLQGYLESSTGRKGGRPTQEAHREVLDAIYKYVR